MKYRINDYWLTHYVEEDHDYYVDDLINEMRKYLKSLPKHKQRLECVSCLNRIKRGHYWSSMSVDLDVKIGDICYIDYGLCFINECSYQHFGLVMGFLNYKALVIPMTSKNDAVLESKEKRKPHLYYIGRLEGLDRESCLFLNDARFINTARIISINAHLNPKSVMFKKIKDSLFKHFI